MKKTLQVTGPLDIRGDLLTIGDYRINLKRVVRYHPNRTSMSLLIWLGLSYHEMDYTPDVNMLAHERLQMMDAAAKQLDAYFMGGENVSLGNPTRKRNRGRSVR